MKKINLSIIAFISSLLLILAVNTKRASADDNSIMTLGVSLTPNQKKGTINTLNRANNGENCKIVTISGKDLVKYLNPTGANFNNNSGVWSSALIQRQDNGNGINVHILPYNGHNNITTITTNQYKNAAITAGISDANIYVTSAIPIDGSGALAGVYAAYAKNGIHLNQEQINAAQQEINTLSNITQQNKDKKGYSDAQLNNAIAGAKAEMAKKGNNLSDNDIRIILNNQLNINHLNNILTSQQKEQIIHLLIEIKKSGALNSKNFQQQASKLAAQIQSKAKDIFNKLNTQQNRNFIQQIIDAIVNFFKSLFKFTIMLDKMKCKK